MSIDWAALLQQGVDDAAAELERRRLLHNEQFELGKLLQKYRDTPELALPSIHMIGTGQSPHWRVWIPAHKEEHFDGDSLIGPWGDTYFDEIGEATEFLRSTLHWMEGGAQDDDEHPTLVPMPEDETLRLLIQQTADTWSGERMPDWRRNEYARGQVELIWNTCNVRVGDEDEVESEVAKDRIMQWVRTEGASAIAAPAPQTEHLRFKVGADLRSWTEFELKDATPAEVEVLTTESDDATKLAAQLYESGRLVEHGTEHDDNPDLFAEYASTALLDVEVITEDPTGMEEG